MKGFGKKLGGAFKGRTGGQVEAVEGAGEAEDRPPETPAKKGKASKKEKKAPAASPREEASSGPAVVGAGAGLTPGSVGSPDAGKAGGRELQPAMKDLYGAVALKDSAAPKAGPKGAGPKGAARTEASPGAGVGELAIADGEGHDPEEAEDIAMEVVAAMKRDSVYGRGLGDSLPAPRRRFRFCMRMTFTILVLLVVNVVANVVTRELTTSELGALRLSSGPTAVGTASLVELHNLNEYATLPVEDLRRVNDISFMHKGVVHYFKISSFRKFSDAHIVFMSPERSVIAIINGRVTFTVPFETEQTLDVKLPQPPNLRGAFVVQTNDPELTGSKLPSR